MCRKLVEVGLNLAAVRHIETLAGIHLPPPGCKVTWSRNCTVQAVKSVFGPLLLTAHMLRCWLPAVIPTRATCSERRARREANW